MEKVRQVDWVERLDLTVRQEVPDWAGHLPALRQQELPQREFAQQEFSLEVVLGPRRV
jgi:hypothetical protein